MTDAFGVTYRFRPIGKTGWLARWCLAVHALALASGGGVAIQMAMSDDEWTLRAGAATAGGAYVIGPFVAPVRTILSVQAVTLLVAMLAWLRWQSRAQEDIWAAGSGGTITPAWAVLWWFVPFANMVKPATGVRELLRGAARLADAHGHDGVLRAIWWGLFLGGQLTSSVGLVFLVAQVFSVVDPRFAFATIAAEDLRAGLWITAVGFLMQAVAASLAIVIVRTVDRRLAAVSLVDQQAHGGLPAAPSVPIRPDVG